MIYELRIYHCVTGRLPALLKRFETTTLELWKRHGIRQAGFWTVLVGDGGNQDLHYLLTWESLAERETKWNAFASDPEWLAKRAEASATDRSSPRSRTCSCSRPPSRRSSDAPSCPAGSTIRPCGARSRRCGRLYRRLGFTVGARNRHAWGTHNHIVQLPGFFVELLTVAEPDKLGTDGFSALFGTFNRLFLKCREGLSMLILESRDAAADAASFMPPRSASPTR